MTTLTAVANVVARGDGASLGLRRITVNEVIRERIVTLPRAIPQLPGENPREEPTLAWHRRPPPDRSMRCRYPSFCLCGADYCGECRCAAATVGRQGHSVALGPANAPSLIAMKRISKDFQHPILTPLQWCCWRAKKLGDEAHRFYDVPVTKLPQDTTHVQQY